jgi:hypothetical protein
LTAQFNHRPRKSVINLSINFISDA